MTKDYTDAQSVACHGEQIYKELFQAAYETRYSGQYVVIDITTKKPYVAPFADEAINKAKADAPEGQFHLIKVGSPAAFRVSHSYGPRHRALQ